MTKADTHTQTDRQRDTSKHLQSYTDRQRDR